MLSVRIISYFRRAHRHQHPPPAKQPDHKRIQSPPVCGNDVQRYSTILCHKQIFKCTNTHKPMRCLALLISRVSPFSSSICIRFIRSNRPHAAPSKYRGFREVVLMCVFALILSPRCLYLVCKPPNRIRQLRCKSFQKNIVPNSIDSRSHPIWLIPAGYFGIPRGSTMVSIR